MEKEDEEMEQDQNSLMDSFEKEIEKIKGDTILSAEFRRKKTILWGIRTLIAIILFVIFWEYNWARWALIAYVPLNIFSLLSIYGVNMLMNNKIKRTKDKIEQMEELIDKND